jgi:hypothetical protein
LVHSRRFAFLAMVPLSIRFKEHYAYTRCVDVTQTMLMIDSSIRSLAETSKGALQPRRAYRMIDC